MATQIPSRLIPRIQAGWSLIINTDKGILTNTDGQARFMLGAQEAFALKHFTGQYSLAQIQNFCQEKLGEELKPTLLMELVVFLSKHQLLTLQDPAALTTVPGPAPAFPPSPPADIPEAIAGASPPEPNTLPLRSHCTLIQGANGQWFIRDGHTVQYLRIGEHERLVVEGLGKQSVTQIAERTGIEPDEVRRFIRTLGLMGLLEGVEPPPKPKRKFSPLSLLFLKFPLFKPDAWLATNVDKLRWIWTQPFAIFLFTLLGLATLGFVGNAQTFFQFGRALWLQNPVRFSVESAIWMLIVVSGHEFAHAFTLKHYGGTVPYMGFMLIYGLPAFYTDTTDAYRLKRRQQAWVLAAGILFQFAVSAFAFSLWLLAVPGSDEATHTYLLTTGAIVTVFINFNPLARFDGYYLLVTLTGLTNLQTRSRRYYLSLFRGKPMQVAPHEKLALILYGPLSLAYIGLIYVCLGSWLGMLSLEYAPGLSALLLATWLVYLTFPSFLKPTALRHTPALHSSGVNARTPMTQQSTSSGSLNAVQTAQQSAQTAPNWFKSTHLATTALVIGGGAIIGLVPLPLNLGGTVELAGQTGSRQVVRPAVSGVVSQLLVKTGDQVKAQEVLAVLSNPDIERQIIDLQGQLAVARQRCLSLREQLAQAQAKLAATVAQHRQAQQQAERLKERSRNAAAGNYPPDIQALREQQELASATVQRLRNRSNAFQDLARQGAYPIFTAQENSDRTREAEQSLQQARSQLAAAIVKLSDQSQDSQAQAAAAAAEMAATRVTIEQTRIALQQAELQVQTLQQSLAKLKRSQADLTVRSPIDGTVLTGSLDLSLGMRLMSGQDLLQIVQIDSLTAEIRVREEDVPRIRVGMPVSFRPRSAPLDVFSGKVKSVDPEPVTDEAKIQRWWVVKMDLQNTDSRLTPGMTGYAKVSVGKQTGADTIWQEITLMVQLERFL